MTIHGLHHVVFTVGDLPAAEKFYRDLFDMDVLFREGTLDGEFGAVPDGTDWHEAVAAGVEPGMSFCRRDGFVLALAHEDDEGNDDSPSSRLDHVALAIDEGDLDAFSERARDLGCTTERRSHSLFVKDRYDVEWELNPTQPPPETPFDPLDL